MRDRYNNNSVTTGAVMFAYVPSIPRYSPEVLATVIDMMTSLRDTPLPQVHEFIVTVNKGATVVVPVARDQRGEIRRFTHRHS
jgi:hypothetical protein